MKNLLLFALMLLTGYALANEQAEQRSIGLALGSGGAGGLAHIAVLEVFGESALNPFGGLGGDGAGVTWTDLAIPLKIVATDYWSGEPVVIKDGDLFQAIRATMTVPGLFPAVPDGDRLLVDGGVSNPLPWDLLADQDLVVAIDVTGVQSPSPDGPPGLSELLFKTFEIMQQSIIRGRLSVNPPDIFIKPELEGIRLLHFDRVDQVVDQARSAAEELREQLLEAQSAWAVR